MMAHFTLRQAFLYSMNRQLKKKQESQSLEKTKVFRDVAHCN